MRNTLRLIFFLLLCSASATADYIPQIARLTINDSLDNFGYQIESAGDINDDGFKDIWIIQNYWTHYDYPDDGLWGLYLYYGGNPMDSIPDLIIRDSILSIKNIKDINDDTFDDFIIAYGLNHSSAPKTFKIYFGGPIFDTIPDKIIEISDTSLLGAQLSYNKSIQCFDIDGNGQKDLIIGAGDAGIFPNSGGRIFILNDILSSDTLVDLIMTGYPFPAYDSYGLRIVDVKLNGLNFLAVSQRGNVDSSLTGLVLLYEIGNTFDTIPDLIINVPTGSNYYAWGSLFEKIGDFNADGQDDFVLGLTGTANGYIFNGGNVFDTIHDITILPSFERLESIGDVNNDTYPDLIVGEQPFKGRAWIYYGGPVADGFVDIKVDPPFYLDNFGKAIKGLGDVNGDGIDDFAVAGMHNEPGWWNGYVMIYAGYNGIPTDVEFEYEPNLPEDFTLKQNYPNPFNPSTTIEFQLPYKNNVTLKIYNSLGQEVRTLLNKELSAGSYKLEWDGKNAGGQSVSSGVYLYKLETNDISISKKMLLLK